MTSVADYYLKLIREQYTKPKTIKPQTTINYKPIKNLTDEQWKPIPEYEYYQISNMGRIKSTGRGTEKLLKISTIIRKQRTAPHQRIELSKNKTKKLHQIHNLVAEAFCPKPKTTLPLRVIHLDGNNLNNKAENLKWVTLSESRKHANRKYGRKNVYWHEGRTAEENSKLLGGSRALVCNRITKYGWCIPCASTIPIKKTKYSNKTCTHIK